MSLFSITWYILANHKAERSIMASHLRRTSFHKIWKSIDICVNIRNFTAIVHTDNKASTKIMPNHTKCHTLQVLIVFQ